MRPNITELVVEQDLCIGCGVCDTICPVNVLNMEFNSFGIYEPVESEGCLDKCTLCIDACPFVKENKNEQELSKALYGGQKNVLYHKDMGYYVNTYEIHKHNLDDRLQSASGGAGHSILKNLLNAELVDSILTVESNNDPDKLFKFSVFTDSEQLEKTRGSAYYPTELSDVLDFVMNNDGIYAVTALPCFAKAIRLAQEKNHKLRKRIKYIIGLVCGQMKTKEFTHELAKNAIGTDELEFVKFRVKKPYESALHSSIEFKGKNGSVEQLSRKAESDSPNKFWNNRMFTPNACNSCIDTFALCADIVLMDAWLLKYSKDYRGHTLVISRTKETSIILETLADISLEKINPQDVWLSQKGVVKNKYAVALGSSNIFLNEITKIKLKVQQLSLQDYENNKEEIEYHIHKIKQIEKIQRIVMLPKRVILKIMRTLKA